MRARVACALWMLAVASFAGAASCGDECAEARDLCEECELDAERCTRFDEASAEYCAEAVRVYESGSCDF